MNDPNTGNVNPDGEVVAAAPKTKSQSETRRDAQKKVIENVGKKTATNAAVKTAGNALKSEGYSKGGQAIAGGVQLAQGYQQYQDGDKVGGSINMAQGGANLAAAAGSQTAATYAPYLSYAAAAYGGYKTLDNDNMSSEQKATRLQQQAGLAVADYFTYGLATPAEGLIRNTSWGGKYLGKLDKLDQKTNPATWALSSIIGGKDADQIGRDKYREFTEKLKLTEKTPEGSYAYTNTAGNKLDFGMDGKHRLENFNGANTDGDTTRGTYDVDWTNPLANETVARLNPLTILHTSQGNSKIQNDATGLWSNKVFESATDQDAANKEIFNLYQKSGFDTKDKAVAALDTLKDKLKEEEFNVHRATLDKIYGNTPTQPNPAPNTQAQPRNPAPQGPPARRKPGLRDVMPPQLMAPITQAPRYDQVKVNINNPYL